MDQTTRRHKRELENKPRLEMDQQFKISMVEVEADKKIAVHEADLADHASFSSSSSSFSGISNGSSVELSDSFEEVTSPSSSSSSSPDHIATDPLNDMSSLFQQLPIKRGLSSHYHGKSQSFTSLANVRSLEDLAKPENPYNKKLKSCRSYGGGLADTLRVKCSKPKKGLHSNSRNSCSSLSSRRGSNSFISRRPPIPPHRSTSNSTMPNQTALFA